jgi:hypothetical protein
MIKDYKTNTVVYANTVNYYNGTCCYSNDKELEPCNNNYLVLHKETQKSYCCHHIAVVKKNYLIEQKEKQKMKLKQKKMEEKLKKMEEKQQQKMEEKLKKIGEKQSPKNVKQNHLENTILSINPVIQLELDVNFCCAILKSGLNKGKQCTYKIFDNELQLCKKHLSYKNINNFKEKDNISNNVI